MTSKQITSKQRIKHISKWIRDYARKAKVDTLVVGISGGIDSSVVSALCAETGLKVQHRPAGCWNVTPTMLYI